MPSNHSSIVGGSTAKRRLACPASVHLEADQPDGPPSVFAEEGTALHTATEYLLERERFRAMTIREMAFNGFPMAEGDRVDAVQFCLDAFQQIVPENAEFWIEVECAFPGIEGAFGTADILYSKHPGHLGLIDWKFGAGVPVTTPGNAQGMFYLAAARATLGRKHATEFDMTFVQPRLSYAETAGVTAVDLDQFEADLKHAIRTAHETPPRVGDHCKWCKAVPICPAQKQRLRLANELRGQVNDVQEMLDLLANLDDVRKDVEARAQMMLEEGVAVPGYKLVRTQPREKWIDEAAAEKWLARAGLKKGERTKTSLITPAQARKLVGARCGKTLPETLAERPQGDLTVARADDRRPEVKSPKLAAEEAGAKLAAALDRAVRSPS